MWPVTNWGTTTSTPSIDSRALGTGARPRGIALGAAGRIGARIAAALWWLAPPVAAGAAASIPVIHSTAMAVSHGWVPAGDDGIIATRGWDVLTSHTPLVGQYSEAGMVIHGQLMHSAGPMLYWLLALPAHYGSVTGLAATMGIVNTLSIVGCVVLARRRGGLALMLATALGVALMCQSLPTEGLHDIWNPAAGLLPFLLLVFCGWSVACGDAWLLPLTALLASYVVQTHLMYVAPTAVVLAVALGGLLVPATVRFGGRMRIRLARLAHRLRQRRSGATGGEAPLLPPRRHRLVWPWLTVALVLAAACWAPPIIDQIRNNPGNLAMIVRTAEHHGTPLGTTVGWHAVVRAVGVRPWWMYVPASEWNRKYDVLAHPDHIAVDSTLAILAALGLCVLVGAWRRRDLAAAALIGLGMCVALGAQAATNPSTSLLEQTLGYTMWWGSDLGFWVWLVLAWALWLTVSALARPALEGAGSHVLSAARPSLLSTTRLIAVGVVSLAGAAGVAAVGDAVAATGAPDSHVYDYGPIRTTAAGIERLLPHGVAVNYGFGSLDLTTQPMETAIRFMLVRRGDRPMAQGSYVRLGPYYEPHGHPHWRVYLTDVTSPQTGMRLAARVHFTGPWGPQVLSAWVGRLPVRG